MFRPALRALTMVVSCATFTACTAPTQESNDSVAYVDDLPCELDVDSAIYGARTLEISFTRSETSGGAVLAYQSEPTRIGGLLLETSGFKETDEIVIPGLNVPIGVRVEEPVLIKNPFRFGEEVGEIGYFEECLLVDQSSGYSIAGPIHPTNGILDFEESFSMFGNDMMKLDISCIPVDGTYDVVIALASEVPENGSISATVNGETITERTGNRNGAPFPADYVILPYNSDTVWAQFED